jgi:recombination DNA repair RAD52 pathway protein
MPEPYLADAIMQGLHPELRLHVLHSKAETVDEILEAARVSEVAHSANTTSASQMEALTAKVDLLLTNMVANKTEETTSAPKKVTFTEAVVAAATTNRPIRERPYSPAGRSPSRSPIRSSDGYQSSAGPLRREWSDNDRPFRRETDRRREMTQDRRRGVRHSMGNDL